MEGFSCVATLMQTQYRDGKADGPGPARPGPRCLHTKKKSLAWNDKGLPIKLYSAVSQTMRAVRLCELHELASLGSLLHGVEAMQRLDVIGRRDHRSLLATHDMNKVSSPPN